MSKKEFDSSELTDSEMDTFMEMYKTLDNDEGAGIILGLIERVIELEKLPLSQIHVFSFLIMEAKKVQVEEE